MNKLIGYFIMGGLSVCFAACQSDVENPSDDNGIPTIDRVEFTEGESAMNTALNEFGYKFFNVAVDGSDNGENVSVSPLSASICLAMTANSGDDNLESKILSMLGVASLSDLNSTVNQLMRFTSSKTNKGELLLANSAWINSDYEMSADWQHYMRNSFYADAFNIDFSNENNKSIIDNWCSDKTRGLIPKMSADFNDGVMCMLVNALYFRGEWKDKFDKSLTDRQLFKGLSGDKTVDMMHASNVMSYLNGSDFKGVMLPMGKNRMMVLLPEEGLSVKEFAKSLSYNDIDNAKANWKSVTLSLPKFESKTSYEVTDVFKEMGLPETCILERIGIQKLSELKAFQDCHTSIDEEGAKAAAVTTVEGVDAAFDPNYPDMEEVTLTIDRPFVYIIANEETKSVIMMGVIYNI